MAVIYNLEFTRIDSELSIYINGRLRAAKFADPHLKINAKYQFYIERGEPINLSIVFYNGKSSNKSNAKHWEQERVAFTLYKSGDKRPMAKIHDYWEKQEGNEVNVKEYAYRLV